MKNLDQTQDKTLDTLLKPVLIACGSVQYSESEHQSISPERIGFKAYNLARMADLKLSVPPAFVLGTAWCHQVETLTPSIWQEALAALEKTSDTTFGDSRRPLLLSVRSGAAISMPGMMETLLNIGLSDSTVAGFLRLTGNPKLVWDAYRRLVSGFGEVVMGVGAEVFEEDLAQIAGDRDERELDFSELRALTQAHLASVQRVTGRPFPQDPHEQLEQAIQAVFASWSADKARDYRRLNQLPDSMGTAVTVQRMVFGNAGGLSGAGVGFSRHPSTGADEAWIDFLFNAQGEDVVSGRRSARGHDALAAAAPRVWNELLESVNQLERSFRDMQDFEFTVENGHLWLLQTRDGKRTAQAQARIALDLLKEGIITVDEARARTEDLTEERLAFERVVIEGEVAEAAPIASAVSAAHGVAIGEIALDEDRAQARQAQGVPVILVRHDAETRDIVALDIAEGLLTARGARTSHAAVVARQLAKVCLVACDNLRIDLSRRCIAFDDVELVEGEIISLDGHNGAIYRGAANTVRDVPGDLLERLEQLRLQ
ncbi:MAG: PEP/pyruvate-binding domain-containing protein [Alcaligenaceae bacterium]|nr:PEP/pyruvate-binding domain-containing protein [Alcaligenaceae bacterium]